jgi:hypothetical protein
MVGKNRDRCYDFKNIFAKKIGEKMRVFDLKQTKIMQKFNHNIGFWEKSPIFSPKIVENRRKLWS